MERLKLKVVKAGLKHPTTKKMGTIARVKTNGTASFDYICNLAGKGSTLDPIEIEACAKAFCRDAAEQLKDGKIVDLGPLGKLYPSCNSTWVEDPDDLTLDVVKPSLYYHPAEEVAAAIRSAKLVWAKAKDEDDEETTPPEGGTTEPTDPETPPVTGGDGDNPGGGGSGDGNGSDE